MTPHDPVAGIVHALGLAKGTDAQAVTPAINALAKYIATERPRHKGRSFDGVMPGPLLSREQFVRVAESLAYWAVSNSHAVFYLPLLSMSHVEARLNENTPVSGGLAYGKPSVEEWNRAAYEADNALNALRAILAGPPDPDDSHPWGLDPAWEGLAPLPRRLLRYMHGKGCASLTDLGEHVWEGKDSDNPAGRADTLLTRANEFLLKAGDRRQLRRKGSEVYWDCPPA